MACAILLVPTGVAPENPPSPTEIILNCVDAIDDGNDVPAPRLGVIWQCTAVDLGDESVGCQSETHYETDYKKERTETCVYKDGQVGWYCTYTSTYNTPGVPPQTTTKGDC